MKIDIEKILLDKFIEMEKEMNNSYSYFILYCKEHDELYEILNDAQKEKFDKFDDAYSKYYYEYLLDFAKFVFNFFRSFLKFSS